jgi:general secretion pathway protein J
MIRTQKQVDLRSGEAGFSLIEMLVATLLMVFIVVALATVTAQWLPNWNYGMQRMERDEHFAFSLNRLVEDLSVAEFVPAGRSLKKPYFEGSELSVTFVRTAVGPNTHPGLEIIRFHEVGDSNGPLLVRDRAMFAPMDPGTSVNFIDPVVLMRPPYRVTFAYAGPDGAWQTAWRAAPQLPAKIRVTVRDVLTQQRLAISTAALVHVDTPVECVSTEKGVDQCLAQIAQSGSGGNPASPSGAPR